MSKRKTIRFKEWLHLEADKLGIDAHLLRTHIYRGKRAMPPHRRINSRVIEVFVDELPTWGGVV